MYHSIFKKVFKYLYVMDVKDYLNWNTHTHTHTQIIAVKGHGHS